MRSKGIFYFLILILFIGLLGVAESIRFRKFEAVLWPLVMTSIISGLTAIELGRELFAKKPEKPGEEHENQSHFEWNRFGSIMGWLTSFFLGIYFLGFFIAIPFFVFSYSKRKRESWFTSCVFAIAAVVFTYGLFEVGLRSPLYRGIIFGGR